MSGQFQVTNPYHSQGLAAGGSALLDAINRGKVHLAKFILDAGECDVVNTRDFKGKTPLIRACYIKEEKTRCRAVELLLCKGANVNLQDDEGRTALSYACELRCNDIVRVLVQNNVDPDIPDKKGNTPLMYSAMIGNDTAIEVLAKCFRRLGLNVDHVNSAGLTALLIAGKNGFIECASLLALEGRACISFRDREQGFTAEEWARKNGCSTPEILPFSSTLALWQYKMNKRDLIPDDTDDLMLHGEVRNCQGRRSYVVEHTSGTDTKLINIEDLSQRMAKAVDMTRPKLSAIPGKMYLIKKRGSLPVMKFTQSPQSSPKRSPTLLSDSPNLHYSPVNNTPQPCTDVVRYDEDKEKRAWHLKSVQLNQEGSALHGEKHNTTGTQTDNGDPTRSRSVGPAYLPRLAAMPDTDVLPEHDENSFDSTTSPTNHTGPSFPTQPNDNSSCGDLACPPGNISPRKSSRASSTALHKIELDSNFDTEN